MFLELQIALRYLVPRRRSLSTALITLVSLFVISLVVWLTLVFLSVTQGMEKNWVQKLTALHAPIRISPTEAYYTSYFYRIDSIASASGCALKTIGEKREALESDAYLEEWDWEIPTHWPAKNVDAKGSLIDPVKRIFQELTALQEEFPGIAFQDYEISGALLRLTIQRPKEGPSYVSQMTYLLSWMDQNPHLSDLLEESKGPKGEGFPIFLPKSYKEQGVIPGAKGSLHFSAPTLGASEEQKIGVHVAGFYDPGIIATGHRSALVPKEVTQAIALNHQTFSPDGTPTNGIFVWIPNLQKSKEMREKIEARLEQAGISDYWKVETYEDFSFARELLHQFQSDRGLLLLIASIILIVACCNIISLLVLLVNDRKKEIAILQAMGASFTAVSSIFALSGLVLGMIGSLIGTGAALLTLHYLEPLVAFLSKVQGKPLLNPALFGGSLPKELSGEALFFILLITPLLSLAAGLIPALKAGRVHPSHVLRTE
ncbi:MAG: ABC transporter permease [Verrucomicrobiota bacterium]|nr:ABC transporter permease [Verrucomicrobiota bacterium]